ncbi:hypothetical protein N7539_007417 [Penicillium diatomitis]|uniref:alpha-1,2-Mannosidase n=1 Tax=Penicillium diatomitis TaxID=2819901 RepID=A0A9W9WV24_9EURO|nr:uncharacterized protein N7539_007417 [Penicillium diatomitis]KAJ5477273.1 hypothetical protein N7539_007417 [Penicillium diatomitis]
MVAHRKSRSLPTIILFLLFAYICLIWLPLHQLGKRHHHHPQPPPLDSTFTSQTTIHLNSTVEKHPVPSYIPLPTSPISIPRIQYDFPPESRPERKARLKKQKAVKQAFLHAWNGYKDHAWLHDEVSPQSGGYMDTFSGWGATLVDSLDALIIMGLEEELELALEAIAHIDFTTTRSEDVNVFEITIRYMGGFLAAHDLSRGRYPVLLQKAQELGEMIYNAFDTPNRMPQMRWEWSKSAQGEEIEAGERTSLAEMGSLTLEFTRLSQLTGNPKYFDAVQRITAELERGQSRTRLPGLWPVFIDAKSLGFGWSQFALGGGADSTYEYLPKQHILLGAQRDEYRLMYEAAMETIKNKFLFRAMTQAEDKRILFTLNAIVRMGGALHGVEYVQEHLKCFLGGMVGLASKVFNRTEDMWIARGLTDGCIWAYDSMPTGIMPEIMAVSPCEDMEKCPWDEGKWYEDVLGQAIHSRKYLEHAQDVVEREGLPPGVVGITDPAYNLRPEAIESIFIMYRITGDKSLQEVAWRMFQNIDRVTRTKYGHSAINDVRNPLPKLSDKMESFWLAETLKYFYLIFSEPELISLDESTEAHPFKRPS